MKKVIKTIALTSNNEIEMIQLIDILSKNESIFDIYLGRGFYLIYLY